MLAGFKYPVLDQNDQEARTKNYAMVQKMSNMFKESMVRLFAAVFCLLLKPTRLFLPLPKEQKNIMPNVLAANMWLMQPG